MPHLVKSAEDFLKLEEKATECRVVRRQGKVKLKLRTPKNLVIYVTTPEEAETLLKSIKVEKVEL